MNLDLADYGLGVVSLFPLLGGIEKLNGFFPRRRRGWFVTISTVFSAIVFMTVALFFERLQLCMPVLWMAAFAALTMVAYITVLLTTDRGEAPKSKISRGIVTVALLILYTVSIMLLTYTFNTLKQLLSFEVYRGTVVVQSTKKPVAGAAVDFVLMDQTSRPTSTDAEGVFCVVIPHDQLSAIHVEDPDQKLCATRVASDIPRDQPFFTNKSLTVVVEVCPRGE